MAGWVWKGVEGCGEGNPREWPKRVPKALKKRQIPPGSLLACRNGNEKESTVELSDFGQ